jgi:hypothetical protein
MWHCKYLYVVQCERGDRSHGFALNGVRVEMLTKNEQGKTKIIANAVLYILQYCIFRGWRQTQAEEIISSNFTRQKPSNTFCY